MNNKDLDILLEKYYRGETTLDEEQQLRESLVGDDADALLMQALKKVEGDIDVPSDLEQEISGMIDQWQEEEEHQEAKVALSLWRRSSWWTIAASVVIIATAGWWFLHDNKQPVNVDDKAPIIAKTTGELTPQQEEEIPQSNCRDKLPQMQSQVKTDAVGKAQRQSMSSSARVLKGNVEKYAQTRVEPEKELPPSLSDEEIAMAAIEKFSLTLNKGVSELKEADRRIEDINKTINKHLL